MNESFGDHIVNIVLQSLEFSFREVVDGAIDEFGIGHKRDFMVYTRTL